MKIGIWSDNLTLMSFEPFPTAARFCVVDIPESWRLAPDFRWPPAWPRSQWSGVVLRGPAGEMANTCDVLRKAHRGVDGFRLVQDIPISHRGDEVAGLCPDCNGEGAYGCPGGYLETCDRCGGSGRGVERAEDWA